MNLAQLLTYKRFKRAFEKVAENNGCAGIDGISVHTFGNNLKAKLQKLIWEIKQGQYRCQPCKVIKIPKNKGAFRQLAIPTVRDRIVQTVLSQAFTPFFEPHFERCSYGYRPERSYLQAVAQLEKYRDLGFIHVLDADIKGYFDHIPQPQLMAELARYISCQPLLDLIETSLQQMQTHQKKCVFGLQLGLGVPQGSPLSPVLANIYLDTLDEALLEADFKVIRFADDFVVLTKSHYDVSHAWNVTQRCLEQLALTFNLEKTRITDFDSGFVFLGHFFIGGLTQVIKNDAGQPLLSQWQWDAPSENNQQPNSAHVIANEPVNNQAYNELQNAINDSQETYQINPVETENLTLNNHCQILYLAKQGAVLHKISGKFELKHAGKTIDSIPITHIDAIMTFGAIHTTRAVNSYCLQHKIPIMMMSQTGHFVGLISHYPNQDHAIINAQLSPKRNHLDYAKQLVESKIHNQISICRQRLRYLPLADKLALSRVLKQSKIQKKQLFQAISIKQILGLEGATAKMHFIVLQQLIPNSFGFNCRNRRPPKDPINALLSLGYSIVFNQILAFCQARGLYIQQGHLHTNTHIPALALDMMEPFRFIVDLTVLQLTTSKAISEHDFTMQNQACLIGAKAKNLFIHALEKQLHTQTLYPALGVTTDLRRCMDLQIVLYKQSLLDSTIKFTAYKRTL